MKIMGVVQAALADVVRRGLAAVSAVPMTQGWQSLVSEPFSGAWQKGSAERLDSGLNYPTLYACISRIVHDIGKLPYRLMQQDADGIWHAVSKKKTYAVLTRPNHYQTPQQFRELWILSKLVQGNAYIIKARDTRGRVIALYVLDPARVMPLVSETGDVYYRLYADDLNLISGGDELVVPASEIIHDRCVCLYHPLIGVPPLAAAWWPGIKNMRILRSSAEFFGNGAQPSGILAAPGAISDVTAKRLSEYWNKNFSGSNAGKVAVVGDGLKFEALAARSVDAQMVEQLRYSDEQICQPFGIPPFKVCIGSVPAGMKVDDINQLYYADALQTHIESMEALLDDGLYVSDQMGIELDLSPLLRMDPSKQADVETKLVGGSIKSPNEGRKAFNLRPSAGGDAIYLQQQNYSLAALAQRDATNPLAIVAAPVETPTTTDDEILDQSRLLAMLIEREMTNVNTART